MSGRLIYVCRFQPEHTQYALDLVRVIANPTTRRAAHISLRGPYEEPLSIDSRSGHSAQLCGVKITGSRIGSFFPDSQGTVYLGCDVPDLVRDAWHKPALGFTPHVTIYDGPLDERARELFDRLTRMSTVVVPLSLGPLEEWPIGSSDPAHSPGYTLQDHRHVALVDRELTIAEIVGLDFDERSALIVKIFDKMGWFSTALRK